MKIAEALSLRADCKIRGLQLRQRLSANVKVQEGEVPSENPAELLRELESTTAEMVLLIQRINRTNSQTSFDGNLSLSDVLAVRDGLQARVKSYQGLAEEAAVRQDRYTRTELKYVSVVNVAELRRKADELSRELRKLDLKIQEMNWTTDLVD